MRFPSRMAAGGIGSFGAVRAGIVLGAAAVRFMPAGVRPLLKAGPRG